jgi:hypothetical protein
MLFNGNLVLTKTNDRFTQLKVLEVTRIERRAVVELTNGWLSDLLMQTEDFLREFEKYTKQNGASIYSNSSKMNFKY